MAYVYVPECVCAHVCVCVLYFEQTFSLFCNGTDLGNHLGRLY